MQLVHHFNNLSVSKNRPQSQKELALPRYLGILHKYLAEFRSGLAEDAPLVARKGALRCLPSNADGIAPGRKKQRKETRGKTNEGSSGK